MSPVRLSEIEELEQRGKLGKPRSRGTLPRLPSGRNVELLRDWLTLAFVPEDGWRFDRFARETTDKTDGCTITFRKGRETRSYWIKPQSDLMGPRLRSIVLSASKGELDVPHLTGGEQEDVWSALCKVGTVLLETDEREETTAYIERMLDATTPLRDYTLEPDGGRRHEALIALRNCGEFGHPEARALLNGNGEAWLPRPIRFIDRETGEQWLRAGETITFVRWVCGAEPMSPTVLRGRLARIGVEAKYFQHHHSPHPKALLYRLTPELIEYVESTRGGEANYVDEARATDGSKREGLF